MEPETLYNLSLEASCLLEENNYHRLPPTVKEQLLYRLASRGACNTKNLRVLIHRRLLKLDLGKCQVMENDLAYIHDLHELKYLILPQPPIVTNTAFSEQALMKVIQNKKRLHTLGLSGHVGVTDKVIRVLVESAHKLQVLRLEGTSILDESLFHLRNLQDLTDLNISHTQVTDAGIEEFVFGDAIKSLCFICLRECPHLSNDSLTFLLRPYYRLNLFEEDLAPNMTVSHLDTLRLNYAIF